MTITNQEGRPMKAAAAFLETLSTLFFDMGDEVTAKACRFHAAALRDTATAGGFVAAEEAVGRYIMKQKALGRHREAVKTIGYLAAHNRNPETVNWPAVANLLGLNEETDEKETT